MSNNNDYYMKNPETNRMIKLGGNTWRKLIKSGIIKNDMNDNKQLYEIKDKNLNEDEKKKLLAEKRDEINNNNNNLSTQAVIGRGIYKDKLVKRKIPASTENMAKFTAKITAKTIKKNIDVFNDDMDEEYINNELQRMILEEMLIESTTTNKIDDYVINKKKKYENEYYIDEEPEEENDEE